MHYNEETDMIQINFNNSWINWKSAGFQIFDFADLTKDDFASSSTLNITTDGTTLTISTKGSQGYDISTAEKITVLEGKKLYYSANNSELYYNGSFRYLSEGGSWVDLVVFSNGKGGSGSVDIPAGQYYFGFGGWAHSTSASAKWNYLYIK